MAVGGQSTSQDDNFLWLLESTGSGYSPPQLLYYDQLQHQFSLLLRTALCYTKLLLVHIRKDNHALTSYLKQVILFIYFFINPNNIDTPFHSLPESSVLLHCQFSLLAGFQQDSHKDRQYWSSAVTQAGLITAPMSKQSARKTHTSPTSFSGVSGELRADPSVSGTADAMAGLERRRGLETRGGCVWVSYECFDVSVPHAVWRSYAKVGRASPSSVVTAARRCACGNSRRRVPVLTERPTLAKRPTVTTTTVHISAVTG